MELSYPAARLRLENMIAADTYYPEYRIDIALVLDQAKLYEQELDYLYEQEAGESI